MTPDEFEAMRPMLSVQPLRMRETLQEAGDPPEFVYFPVSGIISELTVMENGMMIEFATVGHEGTTGVPIFLGMGDSNMALISQVPGEALRMTSVNFRERCANSPSLAAIMSRYSGVMLALVAQSAACNRAHHTDQRCARWLLMTHDQSLTDEFPITHEFLAQMLGVSRPSVTLSAAALQAAGLVKYHRGQMTILDRAGLERASCECYAVIRAKLSGLTELPQVILHPASPNHHADDTRATAEPFIVEPVGDYGLE
jgi:CRP-like cAMP-binding protein